MIKFLINSIILVCAVKYCICNGKVLNNNIKIPSYMRVCHRSDPFLSDCVRQSVEELRPRLKDGIPELQLPSLDPLKLTKMAMNNFEGALSLKSEYRNIIVRGASDFKLNGVQVDPENLRIKLGLRFPKLDLEANYLLKGRILILPIEGTGPCTGNYTDITANVLMQMETTVCDEEEYLKVKDININFDIGDANIVLKDLFGGDTQMGEAMNKYLNENWRSIANEFKPALQKALTGLVRSVADRVFSAFPYRMLLPE